MLRREMEMGSIYHSLGGLTMVMKPTNTLDLYNTARKDRYTPSALRDGSLHVHNNNTLDPLTTATADEYHLYRLGGDVIDTALIEGNNVSIVIYGVSGSGKSFNVHELVRYLLYQMPAATEDDGPRQQLAFERIEAAQAVFDLLTVANTENNAVSSRCARMITIQVSKTSKRVCGFKFDHFLLEGSRLHACHGSTLPNKTSGKAAAQTQSTLAILHQLSTYLGSTPFLHTLELAVPLDELLQHATSPFLLVAMCDPSAIPYGAEGNKIESFVHALELVDVGLGERVISTLLGVLFLGNVSFGNGDPSKPVPVHFQTEEKHLVDIVARLWSLDTVDLETYLLRESGLQMDRSLSKAIVARDSLMLLVYELLLVVELTWRGVREAINESTAVIEGEDDVLDISLLDVCGYEAFGTASHGSLIINAANDALQQEYRQSFVSKYLDDIRADGGDVSADLRTTLESLVNTKVDDGGCQPLLVLLDNAMRAGHTADQLSSQLRASRYPHIRPNANAGSPLVVVEHEAIDAQYDLSDLVSKNANRVDTRMRDLLGKSTLPFLRYANEGRKTKPGRSLTAIAMRDMEVVMNKIRDTHVEWMLCINPVPTMTKSTTRWDSKVVERQLVASAVGTRLKITDKLLPEKVPLQDMRSRFPHLAQVLMNGDADVSDKNIIGRMLSKCQPKMVYTTGRTTVFMPKGTLRRLQELEAAEKVKVQKAAIPRVPLAPVPVVPTPVVLAEPAGKGLSSSASPPPPPPPPPPPALPRLAASRPPASLPQAKQDPSADLTQSDMSMVSVFEPPKIAVLYDSDLSTPRAIRRQVNFDPNDESYALTADQEHGFPTWRFDDQISSTPAPAPLTPTRDGLFMGDETLAFGRLPAFSSNDLETTGQIALLTEENARLQRLLDERAATCADLEDRLEQEHQTTAHVRAEVVAAKMQANDLSHRLGVIEQTLASTKETMVQLTEERDRLEFERDRLAGDKLSMGQIAGGWLGKIAAPTFASGQMSERQKMEIKRDIERTASSMLEFARSSATTVTASNGTREVLADLVRALCTAPEKTQGFFGVTLAMHVLGILNSITEALSRKDERPLSILARGRREMLESIKHNLVAMAERTHSRLSGASAHRDRDEGARFNDWSSTIYNVAMRAAALQLSAEDRMGVMESLLVCATDTKLGGVSLDTIVHRTIHEPDSLPSAFKEVVRQARRGV